MKSIRDVAIEYNFKYQEVYAEFARCINKGIFQEGIDYVIVGKKIKLLLKEGIKKIIDILNLKAAQKKEVEKMYEKEV